ncbi:hypothetical protein HYT02_04145 [Candidatus Gottesmanbacteria bacterium]|nr:hypothetical protein [Candidatus Gottesmanbacteria bacterium]
MPRVARVAVNNAFYHVFHKGNDNQAVFLEESDFEKFLAKLNDLKEIRGFDHSIYCYSILPSQFHLLIYVRKTPLAKIITSLLTSYSMYWNKKYKKKGSVFQGRFRSKVVDPKEYFLRSSRYIHAQPSYFGLSTDPSLYPYSSLGEIMGISHLKLIDKKQALKYIGDSPWALEEYKKSVVETIDQIPKLKNKFTFAHQIEVKDKNIEIESIKQKEKMKVKTKVQGFLKRYFK